MLHSDIACSFFQYFFKRGHCEIAIKGLEEFCKDFDDAMNKKDTGMEMVFMYVYSCVI